MEEAFGFEDGKGSCRMGGNTNDCVCMGISWVEESTKARRRERKNLFTTVGVAISILLECRPNG